MDTFEKIGCARLAVVAGCCLLAIFAIRFVTSPVMQGAAELLVYGTAVALAPEH